MDSINKAFLLIWWLLVELETKTILNSRIMQLSRHTMSSGAVCTSLKNVLKEMFAWGYKRFVSGELTDSKLNNLPCSVRCVIDVIIPRDVREFSLKFIAEKRKDRRHSNFKEDWLLTSVSKKKLLKWGIINRLWIPSRKKSLVKLKLGWL